MVKKYVLSEILLIFWLYNRKPSCSFAADVPPKFSEKNYVEFWLWPNLCIEGMTDGYRTHV